MTDDEGVLSPDDLELPDDDVTELDEDRMVVHPDSDGEGVPEASDRSLPDSTAGSDEHEGREPDERGRHEEPAVRAEREEPDAQGVREERDSTDGTALLRDAADVSEAYALAVGAKTEAGLDEMTVRSNDVGRTFESFLRWYAGQVAPGRDPEEVLRVLVSASNLDAEVRSRR